jgi:phenylalanyl-tRNA synthetase alpha chain
MVELAPLEKVLLQRLHTHNKTVTVEELAAELGRSSALGPLSPDSIRRSAEKLVELGWIVRDSQVQTSWAYADTAEVAIIRKEGLPQVQLLRKLVNGAVAISTLPPELTRFGLPAAKKEGWVQIVAGQVMLTQSGQALLTNPDALVMPTPEQLALGPAPLLMEWERFGIVKKMERKTTLLSINEAGAEAVAAGAAVEKEGEKDVGAPLGALDREMLRSGSWKEKNLRRYDVNAPVEKARPARRHPISRLREQIKLIFLSMGFEEMEGPLAESAFWNFDALFQPQDHPARDLADTFYLPGETKLPERGLVAEVKAAHEKGWNYDWSETPAKQQVLRTHTTAVSARTMHETASDKQPRKFFGVGKVFRNEATDYKHLAEFFQVEGIIVDEKANLPQLLGTLKAFYGKLGFEKIRFRPSYFPYTEPSLEIEVFHPMRKTWLELGGAGILRPEVCGPLGGRYPVLAWGLSLERPLMLANKIEDIRTLYRNDLGWLRNFQVE